ncbi:hypothetical protein [Streptomyces cylindrosporus]|uniref:Uncharacterized protein n=1 Tax=Streptomyces cylindrosporus TaxID=2927583 RepID=A0ABS9YGE2_9ACTN|nr:hypothetical protein [Streptomyces cylindrosporus]MCI3276264.1 hypothetical protein [Streptomyces cylindrosporus]
MIGQSRQQQQQQLSELERWRYGIRQAAYNACIASTKQLSSAWRAAAHQFRDQASTPAECQVCFDATLTAWAQFSSAVASVAVAGPQEAVDAVDQLREAMREWDWIGTSWFQEIKRSGLGCYEEFDAPFTAAIVAKQVPERAFQETARRALGTDR